MNIVLSKNNHLRIGYNGVPYSVRSNLYDKFYLDFEKLKSTDNYYRATCIKSACEISDIAESKNLIPLILYSEDISSDLMVFSFLKSGRKFNLAYINTTKDKHIDQNLKVYQIATKYNLNLSLFDLNINDKILFDYAVRDNVYDVKNYLFSSITNEIKKSFFPVSNSIEIEMYRSNCDLNLPSEWFMKIRESSCAYYFHCLNESIDACPSFNLWSPDMLNSFLSDKRIKELIENKSQGKVSLKSTEIKVYRNAFPEYNLDFLIEPSKADKEFQNKINFLNKNLRMNIFYDKHSSADFLCKNLTS